MTNFTKLSHATMQTIIDIECKSANDLKTILEDNNKETKWFFSNVHKAMTLTNLERTSLWYGAVISKASCPVTLE